MRAGRRFRTGLDERTTVHRAAAEERGLWTNLGLHWSRTALQVEKMFFEAVVLESVRNAGQQRLQQRYRYPGRTDDARFWLNSTPAPRDAENSHGAEGQVWSVELKSKQFVIMTNDAQLRSSASVCYSAIRQERPREARSRDALELWRFGGSQAHGVSGSWRVAIRLTTI